MNLARWALAFSIALALWLRVGIPMGRVFLPGFVNFQETDAWFHVRVIDHLIAHFPIRLFIDPYGSILDGQRVDTGPFFDWVGAILCLPFPAPLHHHVLAFYPALLGVLIIPVVYLLGRELYGRPAAALAALVASTLPGYFLLTGSLGFTDHHVMESLLSTVVLYLLAARRPVLAGLALGAYLLTFVGGAFLVGIVAIWSAYGFLRNPEDPGYTDQLVTVFATALPMTALTYGTIWTEYSLAALGGGLAAAGLARYCRRLAWPRAVWLGILLCIAAAGLALFPQALQILSFFNPSRSGASTVGELKSLWFSKGYFSLDAAWHEFGGVYILTAIGIALLGEGAIRRPQPALSLLFFWTLATFVLSLSQFRMVYYLAPAAAVLAGHLVHRAWTVAASRPREQPVVGVVCFCFVFAPNLWTLADRPYPPNLATVTPAWMEALDWLRTQTPEPYGDPNAFHATGIDPASARYGVLSWWDFGYWISAIGHRIPLSNPTQKNASVAAAFLLAESEPEAMALMKQWRLRYVVFDERMDDAFYPAYFAFLPDRRKTDYLIQGMERLSDGTLKSRRFYTPAYYRSMASRLSRGGRAAEPAGAFLVTPGKQGDEFAQIRSFDLASDAARAQAACAADGCLLAGDSPAKPCVPVEALTQFRQEFSVPFGSVRIFAVP